MTADPLPTRANAEPLFLVTFLPAQAAPPARARRVEQAPAREDGEDFEEELKATRDELRGTTEQFETANEELKAANEEITSVNEELQATNEELEASKEELQSLNEELNAVNSQLERKVIELEQSGDDLRNLLAGNEIATIFLDTHLRIKWFTPAVRSLFELLDQDIGRPIANFAQKFGQVDLIGKAEAAINRLATFAEEVPADDGRCFLLRVQPYQTRDNHIAGAVATFIDISELKAKQGEIAASRDYAEAIVNTMRDPLLVLSDDLRLISANPAFYKMFNLRPSLAEGQKFLELNNGQWDTPRLRELLEELLLTNSEISDFEVRHDFPAGERFIMINARRIAGDGDRPDLILMAKQDVTERRYAEERQELLVAELSHRVKNTLAVVASIANQTLRRSDSLESFGDAFLGRLHALGRAHDMVLQHALQDLPLTNILELALKPFQADGQIAIRQGPAIDLGQVASQSLTMILHELATNAVKYGALSAAGGKVAIGWRVKSDGGTRRVTLIWAESGGPAVRSPVRRGHGSRFIERSAAYELRGKAALEFAPEGFRAQIEFPLKPPEKGRKSRPGGDEDKA